MLCIKRNAHVFQYLPNTRVSEPFCGLRSQLSTTNQNKNLSFSHIYFIFINFFSFLNHFAFLSEGESPLSGECPNSRRKKLSQEKEGDQTGHTSNVFICGLCGKFLGCWPRLECDDNDVRLRGSVCSWAPENAGFNMGKLIKLSSSRSRFHLLSLDYA